jgi:hypothetical protein
MTTGGGVELLIYVAAGLVIAALIAMAYGRSIR